MIGGDLGGYDNNEPPTSEIYVSWENVDCPMGFVKICSSFKRRMTLCTLRAAWSWPFASRVCLS